MTTPPVTTRLVQKIAEGKTFYELSLKVKVMIKKKKKTHTTKRLPRTTNDENAHNKQVDYY